MKLINSILIIFIWIGIWEVTNYIMHVSVNNKKLQTIYYLLMALSSIIFAKKLNIEPT